MITLQSRGVEFDSNYDPADSDEDIFVEMEQAFGFERDPSQHWHSVYLDVLTKEGEAFRQRFVDYEPPEEAPA